MRFIPTDIPDVIEIQPEIHGDSRGYFMETFQKAFFLEAGITTDFVQDNQSRSKANTLRGLHYQIEQPQGKLVRALEGSLYDVVVDLRRSSATYKQWVGIELSAEKGNQLWVPPGFAHGFLALGENTTLFYKCTDFYAPQHERCLLWNDPELNIDWPLIDGTEPLLSTKDQAGQLLKQAQHYA